MYTYEYEHIWMTGVMKVMSKEHKEVIDRRAEDGWRYVGFIPAVQSNGILLEMDLIFEKEM